MLAQKPEEINTKKQQVPIDSAATKKEQIKKLKKKNKLTFDIDQVTDGNRIKSSHQVLKDSKLSNEAAISQEELAKKLAQKEED